MKKRVIKIILFLICFFVYDFASSQSLTVNVEFNQDEQFCIREGILCPHKQTIKFKAQGKRIAKIKLGEPVIVAIADEPEKWGFFQFPYIFRMGDGTILISWQMRADSYDAYGKKNAGKNMMMSRDKGRTWIDYDGSYDRERYSYSLNDGEQFFAPYVPAPKNVKSFKRFPNASSVVQSYGETYKFYRDTDLPEELNGSFVRRWKSRSRDGDPIQLLHAKFNDEGLYRYSVNDQMSVLWNGDIVRTKKGDIIGSNYRGFYADDKGRIQPSGISFYKWNEDEVAWDILGKIPFQPDLKADSTGAERVIWGFTEPAFTELADRTLVCIVRSSEQEKLTPMYQSVSKDGGKTWSKPVAFTPNGVKPSLLTLDNGTLVLTSGRPGVQMRFNLDGTGENWTAPIDMLPFMNGEGSYTGDVSCGYTGLLAIDKNTFLLVYSDFLEHNNQGEVRKAIKVRKIKVKNYIKRNR